jgi:diguanylate cyclase (GGDEF)-like protein/putative nucleotidyltransferase with HDIG domain
MGNWIHGSGAGLMKELSLKAKIYIFTIILGGLLVLINSFPKFNVSDPWMLLALSTLASLSLVFKVEGATDRLHYNISFLIYSFTFILLGPADAILVILISNLAEWVWHKYAWYIQIFNIANYLVAMYATGAVFELISPGMNLHNSRGILGALVAMLVFTFINHLLIGTVVWLARGENYLKSGVFDALPLMIDFTLLCMGVGTALVWMINPYAITYSVLPLYLIYTTLKVPALERQSEMDSKTGLFNAKYFSDALTKEIERANRFDRPITVVMADLDLLRNINNTYGHLAGDEVLVGVAKILKESVREYDIVARFGGEEFAILMPETHPQEIVEHVENIRSLIEEAEFTVPTSVLPIRTTMSFGIAGRNGFNQTAGDIVHNSDTALYHAKLKGRNRVHVYSDEGFEALFEGEKERELSSNEAAFEERIRATEFTFTPNPLREQPTVKQHEDSIPENQKDRGKSRSYPTWMTNLFIASLAVVASIWFLILVKHFTTQDWVGLLLFTAMVIITEGLSVDIYIKNTSVSTSAAPMLGGILLYGPVGALVLSLTFGVVSQIKHRSPFSRLIFNTSNQLVAGLTYTTLLYSLGISFFDSSPPIQILITLAVAGIDYLLTTCLVSVAMHFSHGVPVRRIWDENFSWLAPYYASMGLIAFAMVFSYISESVFGLLVLLVPLLLVRLSQKQFIDRTRVVVQELRDKNMMLEGSSREIARLNESLLDALAEVVDMRDPFVLGHSKHVTRYAVMIAQRLGLPQERVELIRKASLLHDIGKLGIPDNILLKPSKLSSEEFEVMKAHTTLGSRLLETSRGLRNLIPIVRHHHERFDGSGYPDGLKGKDIPLEARIVSLADAVEAMASDRPYRKARKPGEILYEIQQAVGTQFDPEIVKVFIDAVRFQADEIIVNSGRKYLDEHEKILVWRGEK